MTIVSSYSSFYRFESFDSQTGDWSGFDVEAHWGTTLETASNTLVTGDSVVWPGRAAAEYSGFTYEGAPIIRMVGSGQYVLFSNNDAVSTTGTATAMETEILCFVRGTQIATSSGPKAVQDLRREDWVYTKSGGLVPVKWLGRQRFNPLFGIANLPICIKAGALGAGVPTSDLYVSPDHALCIDDCLLVHASALVNGRTIYQVREWPGDVEYYHIETENHEIILAEGAPVETYMDNVSRSAFYNHAEYEALYPQAAKMVELDLPRVKYARQLPNFVKQRLERIADSLLGEKTLDVA